MIKLVEGRKKGKVLYFRGFTSLKAVPYPSIINTGNCFLLENAQDSCTMAIFISAQLTKYDRIPSCFTSRVPL